MRRRGHGRTLDGMDHSDTARERPETDDQATTPEGSTTAPTTAAATDAPAGPRTLDTAEPAPDVTPPGDPTARSPRFTLHRSRTDRMISGVSGGLAESLAVDPTLVRLGFVALALVGFPLGFVLYVAIWMLAPER